MLRWAALTNTIVYRSLARYCSVSAFQYNDIVASQPSSATTSNPILFTLLAPISPFTTASHNGPFTMAPLQRPLTKTLPNGKTSQQQQQTRARMERDGRMKTVESGFVYRLR